MAFPDLVERIDRAVQGNLGGVSVTYEPAEGDPVEVTGVFDEVYHRVIAAEAGVEQIGPAVWFRLDDLPEDPDDDDPLITIAGNLYRVVERQRDGMGSIRLLLHRADVDAES